MDHFYLSRKRLDPNTFYTSKNTFTHQEIQIPQLFTQHPKTAPKHSLSTITHSKTHPHPYQNQNLIIFSFSCLSTKRKRGKFQPSQLLQLCGQEVKFCWYNFSFYHFHFLFYSIFIILVNSSCFHHPFRIIMHYYGFWLWQFRIWML